MTRLGPKHGNSERAAFEAERYRTALVSLHDHMKALKEQNDVLQKQIVFLKKKRREEAQQAYGLKQRIKRLLDEIEEYKQHTQFAAGELRVTLPPPRSEMAIVLRAYRQLRQENEELIEQLTKRG